MDGYNTTRVHLPVGQLSRLTPIVRRLELPHPAGAMSVGGGDSLDYVYTVEHEEECPDPDPFFPMRIVGRALAKKIKPMSNINIIIELL